MDWRTLEARLDGIQIKAWGEGIRLSFLKGGALDVDRPTAEIRAILHTDSDLSNALQQGLKYRTRLSAGRAELIIDRATYAGPPIRSGDRVRANDREGQPWYEVAAVSDLHSNLLVLTLNNV
jgi:hypothetical protein